MLPISNESAADMRERIQHLKAIERTRYQLPRYVSELTTYAHGDAAVDCRLQRVLGHREKTLRLLYNCRGGAAVMGSTSFIFDRYLSQVVPKFVLGQACMPYRVYVIGIASLFIASKSLLPASESYPIIERILRRNEDASDIILRAERDILTKLNWDIIYPSPIAIVEELLTLLPGTCDHEEHELSLQAFKPSVLDNASYLTRLAAIHYDFVSTFPPSTIALAALKLALESPYLPTKDIALFNRVSPASHFTLMFNQLHLGLSFEDQDVRQCYEWLIIVLEELVQVKRSPSPTKVLDVHNKEVL